MNLVRKTYIYILLTIVVSAFSCMMHKRAVVSASPAPINGVVIENTIVKPVETIKPSAGHTYPNGNFKLFRDSITAFWRNVSSKSDDISLKQDRMLSKMDTAMMRQMVNSQNINNLLYILSQQTVDINRLNKTVDVLSKKATVSKETKQQALFSGAVVKSAVYLNFALLIIIILISLFNLIFTLTKRTTNLKTEPK